MIQMSNYTLKSDHEQDAWFRIEVEEGVREIERGEVRTHEEVKRYVLKRCKQLNFTWLF